jgi:hypothetical protein
MCSAWKGESNAWPNEPRALCYLRVSSPTYPRYHSGTAPDPVWPHRVWRVAFHGLHFFRPAHVTHRVILYFWGLSSYSQPFPLICVACNISLGIASTMLSGSINGLSPFVAQWTSSFYPDTHLIWPQDASWAEPVILHTFSYKISVACTWAQLRYN